MIHKLPCSALVSQQSQTFAGSHDLEGANFSHSNAAVALISNRRPWPSIWGEGICHEAVSLSTPMPQI